MSQTFRYCFQDTSEIRSISTRSRGRKLKKARWVWAVVCLSLLCIPDLSAQETLPAPSSGVSIIDLLAEPAGIERFQLSGEQQTRFATLKSDRAAALQAAPADQQGAVLEKFENEARTLLTPDQTAILARLNSEPKLRFNFRFQKWTDVLEWFAKQSDLSLVLDAPPPGTFNYTDNRDYTPAEAIDLLNGVLSSKGYTLIRRNRMLMLIDLQNGVPDNLLPRVTLDELDKRGRYEFVSVMFPLEGRDPKSVNEEIKPLLGQHGKSHPLPQTKQILVSDTAGIMRSIQAIIESIPKPAVPAPPPPTPPAPPAILVVYPVEKLDAEAVTKVISALLPTAKVIPNPTTKQVNVHAPEKDQETAKFVIDQMLAKLSEPSADQPKLEVYPLTKADAAEVLASLSAGLPAAKLRLSARSDQLVAWATTEDQAKIKAALEKLGTESQPKNEPRTIQVYELENSNPGTLTSLLQELVPHAQFTADTTTGSLIAIATEEEHTQIKSALHSLRGNSPQSSETVVRYYPLPNGLPKQFLEAATAITPQAKLIPDLKEKRLLVIAKGKDQEKLQGLLNQLQQETPPPEKPILVSYPLTTLQKSRFEAILPTLTPDFPDLKTVTTNEPGTISLWGTPSQHTLIKEILLSLNTQPEPDHQFQLTLIPLKQAADGSTILTSLETLFPGTRVTLDLPNSRLMVWASPDETSLIQNAVDKLQASSQELRFYPFPEGIPSALSPALTAMIPKLQVTPDTQGKRLMVIATPADHEKVKETIERVTASAPPPQKGELRTYPVTQDQKNRLEALLPTLTQDFPNLKIILNTQPGLISIWAFPEQQIRIEEILKSLGEHVEPGEQMKLALYPLKHAEGAPTLTLLQTLFPSTKITHDSQTGKISVWGTPEQQAAIRQALEQIDTEPAPERREQFMVYPVQNLDTSVAMSLLQTLAPKAKIIQDNQSHTLVVYATQHDHEQVSKTLQNLQEGTSAATRMSLKVYPIGKSNSNTITNLIRSVAPETRQVPDPSSGGIVVWGLPSEHEKIATALKDLEINVSEQAQPLLETYKVRKTTPSQASSVILSALPDVRISYNSNPEEFNVWGLPADQVTVRTIVDKLEAGFSEGPEETMVIYSVPTTGAANAIGPLQRGAREASISYSHDPEKLIVWAKPHDHAKVVSIIQELEAKSGVDEQLSMEVYTTQEMTAGTAMSILQRALPKVGLTADTHDSRRFVAWGRPKDHERIIDLIKQFDKKSSGGDAPFLQIYSMPKNGASQAYAVASRIAPYASINLSTDQNRLIVWARKTEQDEIRQLTERIELEATSHPDSTLVVYSAPSVGASYLMPLIQKAFPKSSMNVGSDPSQLLVWAHVDEHEQIKKIVEGAKDTPPGEAEGEVVVYKVTKLPASSTLPMLQRAVPKANFSMGPDQTKLVVWGRPSEHNIVKKLLDQLEATPPDQNPGEVGIYHLTSTGASTAIPVLQKAAPRASISVSADPNTLVVWAQSEDHEIVKTIVDQLESQTTRNDQLELAVYDIKKAGITNALTVLQKAFPRVTFTPGADPGKLIAWAKPADQTSIQKLVGDLNDQLDSTETQSKVYNFKTADPQAAFTALSTLVPSARLAVDQSRRTIIAVATPRDHERLAAAITEIEESGSNDSVPVLRSYSTGESDPLSIWNMVYNLFQGRTDTKVTVDTDNRAVVISAPESQHKIIKEVLDEIMKGNNEMTLEQHPLRDADPNAVSQIVTQLLRSDSKKVRITADSEGGQLIVFGGPKHHALVKETINRLQREKQTLEVVTLDEVDVFTAETAIRRLLNNSGRKGPYVTIDSDYDRQQLYISATSQQMNDVRELLTKMGETSLTSTVDSANDRGATRIIPFEGNLDDALRQIQGVWPRIRKNEIKVITPARRIDLKTPAKPNSPDTLPILKSETSQSNPPENNTPAPNDQESLDDALESAINENASTTQSQPLKESSAPVTPEEPTSDSSPVNPPQTETSTQKPEKTVAETAAPQPAPIVIIPGEGQITISSEDKEALDQLETILRNLSRPERNKGGKDFAIFMLKNTSADQVAKNLEDLFGVGQSRGGRGRSNLGGPVIVADQRINAILVHGSRSDRDAIEELLTVLDSPEILDFRSDKKTERFILKNARAMRVERVLRDLYRTQLATASNSQPIPIPIGASLEVVSALQTINAATASPILTLTVDEVTNSVIALGPEALVSEVGKIILDLDQGAIEDQSRKLSIITLKKMNAEHARQALNAVLQDNIRRSRNSGN